MKLQKLTFYVKAWGLVWNEEELFPEEYQAWANGAVSPILYNKHRGLFKVSKSLFSEANVNNLTDPQKETIDKVLEFYGDFTAQQLSDINHQETPWLEARGDLPPMERSTQVIPTDKIAEYYSGIFTGEN
jgi:uncharacterized phage-associated protein